MFDLDAMARADRRLSHLSHGLSDPRVQALLPGGPGSIPAREGSTGASWPTSRNLAEEPSRASRCPHLRALEVAE